MRKNRIVSLILCLIMIISFCGCETAKSGVKIISEEDLIGNDGCFLYQIISAEENADIKDATKEATNLKKQLAEAFDIKVNSDTDKKVKASEESYEILLGNTNREESEKAYDFLKENRVQNINDWMIKVYGNKICIVSITDENLPDAVRYFNTEYCTKLSDFSKLTEDFQYIEAPDFEVKNSGEANIAGNKIGEYTIITAREKSLLYTLKISEFVKTFEEKYGIKIAEGQDAETKESKCEIIVGNTNRELSKTYNPSGDNWVIAVDGGKLVVNGGSDTAIASAFQKILDLELSARKENKAFELKEGFKQEGKADTKNEYKLAWADEFNVLNKNIWSSPIGGKSQGASPNGGTTYNNGIEDCFIRNGNLVMPSKRLNQTDFTSSSVQSRLGFAFRYGIMEVRMKFAPTPMCSTIWCSTPDFQIKNGKSIPLTIKNRMELDIVENYGQTDWFASNVHHWWTDGSKHSSLDGTKFAESKKYTYSDPEKFASEYHIFSYEWTPYSHKFALDGKVYFEYDISTLDNTAYTQVPMDIRLSAGYGSTDYYLQKKYADDAPKYGEGLVDYVRVYQSDEYDNILWNSPMK